MLESRRSTYRNLRCVVAPVPLNVTGATHERHGMKKFDILDRAPAMEAEIARTTNKLHLRILENYRRHAILEVCGMYQGILVPEMIVPHPVYRFHTPKGTRVIEGMDN